MRYLHGLLTLVACAPLAAQAWDVRVELPFAEGQELPGAAIQTMGQLSDGGLGKGKGVILSVNHRLVRVNPVVRLDWTVEIAQWKAEGDARIGATTYGTRLSQKGLGVGLNAQFWIPFTGVAGELGVIQRLQDYDFSVAGSDHSQQLSRTWLRMGARWRMPMPAVSPYVAISYQRPLSNDQPVSMGTAQDLALYLAAQGRGQEFDRMWTLGVGVQF